MPKASAADGIIESGLRYLLALHEENPENPEFPLENNQLRICSSKTNEAGN